MVQKGSYRGKSHDFVFCWTATANEQKQQRRKNPMVMEVDRYSKGKEDASKHMKMTWTAVPVNISVKNSVIIVHHVTFRKLCKFTIRITLRTTRKGIFRQRFVTLMCNISPTVSTKTTIFLADISGFSFIFIVENVVCF